MSKPVPDPPEETSTPLEAALRADDLAKNREAIKRAVNGEPTAAEVVAKKSSAQHPFAPN